MTERHLKVLVYGDNGTGKTQLGVTAPRPLILLNEPQGLESVRDAAVRLKREEPPAFIVTTAAQMRAAVALLRERAPADALVAKLGPLRAGKPWDASTYPRSIVVDSQTEAVKLIGEEIDEQSPPKLAKDNLPQKSDRYWNVLQDRADSWFRALRNLEYHVLHLALKDDREVGPEDNKKRVVRPMMPMHKLGAMLASTCNAVGGAGRESKKGEDERVVRYTVTFSAPDFVLSKKVPGLDDVEEPDFSTWVAKWTRYADRR